MSINLLVATWDTIQSQFSVGYDLDHIYRIMVEADKANPVIKGFIIQAFRLIDGTTSTFKKDAIIDAVERVAYRHDQPRFFNPNEGEDFCFIVDLEPGKDFTGYWLTIRNAEDGVLLSPDNIAGTAEDLQEVNADDLPLAAGSFYKIHVLLEHGATAANGDAAVLLADAILIVSQDIDI